MTLSIIVCTHNRSHAIEACLNSIAVSIAAAAPVAVEVVVVDNASTDATSEIVSAWARRNPIALRLVYESHKGLSFARNCGIQLAKGDILAFTDDDCRMDNNYIPDLLRHVAADSEPVLRGGRIDLGDPNDLPLSIKTQSVMARWMLHTDRPLRENLADSVYGCNMVIPRSVINTLGLFDTRLGAGSSIPGGEDTDYIYRAYLAGIPIEYVPDMAVAHYHGRKSSVEGYTLVRNYAIGTGGAFCQVYAQGPVPMPPILLGLQEYTQRLAKRYEYLSTCSRFLARR